MRIAVFHNYYQQPGGEDAVFADETALLQDRGHELETFTRHNDVVTAMRRLALVSGTIWNRSSYKSVRDLFRHRRPEVAHFHNTFPLISPAAYYAARSLKVPVVQTLHNYRLLCPNAFFFRDGQTCEDCLVSSWPWPGIYRGCYRGSRQATAVVAVMLAAHSMLGTWREVVDVYIALTDFARLKFIAGGLPEDRIMVKPNFVHPDPGPGEGRGGFALFVGRLSEEKGIRTMLSAWSKLGPAAPLKIIGDGPLADVVAEKVLCIPGAEYLGRKSPEEVYTLMGEAKVLIFPSVWYEGLPRTIVESFARGTPVIASFLGAMESLVEHERTGLHFRPGDASDLAAQVEWAFTHPRETAWMRRETRAEFEVRYTVEQNYKMLLKIYHKAMERVETGR